LVEFNQNQTPDYTGISFLPAIINQQQNSNTPTKEILTVILTIQGLQVNYNFTPSVTAVIQGY